MTNLDRIHDYPIRGIIAELILKPRCSFCVYNETQKCPQLPYSAECVDGVYAWLNQETAPTAEES